jgi:hypothetical protein
MAADLPPELLEDLMLVEALNVQGGLPGRLDGIDDNAENPGEVNLPAVGEDPGSASLALAEEQNSGVESDDQDSEDAGSVGLNSSPHP